MYSSPNGLKLLNLEMIGSVVFMCMAILVIFIAKCIQADPDAWEVLLTTKHRKTGEAQKFV